MAKIHLRTSINAGIETCFNLARSVEAHQLSTTKTNEKAIAGRLSGLCELGDTITWEATHFGVVQQLTVEITKLKPPFMFEDRMLKGAFKSMRHRHTFESANGTTLMTDQFEYDVPFGIIGKLFDSLVLKRYMTRFLINRNQVLKSMAEQPQLTSETMLL